MKKESENTISVLIVDDDVKGAKLLAKALSVSSSFDIECVFSGEDAVLKAREGRVDVFLMDLNLPGMDGLKAMKIIREIRPYSPVIIITGHNEIQTAVGAIKNGAYDYLVKPLEIEHVANLVSRSYEQMFYLRKDEASHSGKFAGKIDQIVCAENSPLILLLATARKVAVSDTPVLITGDSGTGKELFADMIHKKSLRSNNPFIVVNCGAIPAELFESELFGHEKGSFTGAHEKRDGLFLLADKGTILMDEVGDMPLYMQVKLLRTLQSGEVRRIGGNNVFYVNTRVIAATSKNLEQEVACGRFREDLYYRLNVINLKIPALNERKCDIPLLVDFFIKTIPVGGKKVDGIEPEGIDLLCRYSWPGNIRELKNTIERLMLLCEGQYINVHEVKKDIGPRLQNILSEQKADNFSTLENLEKQQITNVMNSTGGNKMQAAKILGITVQTLYNKLNRYFKNGGVDRE